VGNPNCGKTTIFNKLTGSRQYVGNWPGVTVERKNGKIKFQNEYIPVTDLPGIYSLSPYTTEEKVAADYIRQCRASVIVNIADSTNLERNLYLTLQLLEKRLPVILALNMTDELEKKNTQIDYTKLSGQLGVPVIPVSGKTGKGLSLLVAAIEKADRKPILPPVPKWSNDPDSRYAYIELLMRSCVRKEHFTGKMSASDRWDSVLTHRIWGLPIFAGIMFLIFFATFGMPGSLLQDGIAFVFNGWAAKEIALLLHTASAPPWLSSLLIDGVLGGVGGVLSFLPQIAILFFLLSFLEDSGYMARIAFIMDRTLRKFGLSGKAFIPMLMGFGCSVPAIMAARTMENTKDRRMTILLIPFMSCSAKLPIYSLLAGALFKEHRTLIVFSLYFLGIAVGVLSGVAFKNTLFRGQNAQFIMELPPYRMPGFRDTLRHVWDKISHFLKKAAGLILVMSIILWFLQNFDCSLRMTNTPEESILAVLGGFLAPAFRPLGFGTWQLAVALLAGLAAKESVVACLSMFYGTGIAGAFASPAAAYAFLVFVLLYVPCVAAVATMKKEFGGWRWAAVSILWQLICAYLVSFTVYRLWV
jgi:ferrous iron transport protein B